MTKTAAPTSSLRDFISHARKQGLDLATIKSLLKDAGWKERDVLQAFSDETLKQPIPEPPDTGGARDAFEHVLIFGLLYTTLGALMSLWFSFINRTFPDIATDSVYREYDFSGERFAIAAILVAFPLLAWLSRRVNRDISKNPLKAKSAIRRWLTYFTLLITSGLFVGTMIALIFSFLEGEFTIRFLLKVAVLLTIAVLTFTYYIFSLRIQPTAAIYGTFHRRALLLTGFAVAVSVVWGIVLVGSPLTQRERRFDEQRVSDLRIIAEGIRSIVYDKGAYDPGRIRIKPIPQSLDQAAEQAEYQRMNTQDPQTGEPYGYTVLSSNTLELCATFTTERDQAFDIFWNHPSGRHCFTVDVREDSVR